MSLSRPVGTRIDKSVFLDVFLQKVQQHVAEKNPQHACEVMKSIIKGIDGSKFYQKDLSEQQIAAIEKFIATLKTIYKTNGYFELEFVYNLKKQQVFEEIAAATLKKQYADKATVTSKKLDRFFSPAKHKKEDSKQMKPRKMPKK